MVADLTTTATERADIGVLSDGLLARLRLQPADPLLSIITAYQADPRPGKIDLGVGVYRDDQGHTPVLRAVKAAERRLLEEQTSKAYLGPEGDIDYFERLVPIVLGQDANRGRLCGLQTTGGTGALRLAAELAAKARPNATIWLGEPTWSNHPPIFGAAGLGMHTYKGFSLETQTICFDETIDALKKQAQPGDIVLLHGCCHNPTGADFDAEQWQALARLCAERGLFPLIDLAYQGLGDGLEQDAAGARAMLDTVGEGLIAYSCDKNFGLYRERVGALFALSADAGQSAVTQSNLLSLARANWSMPPDHGAAVVRTILSDPALTADWRAELEEMRTRIAGLRTLLAAASPDLAAIARQRGLFSSLALTREQIARLCADHAIYMAGSGRINIAGLRADTIETFVAALAAVR